MVAAATLTEAEVFCQCAVCLRKMQYMCGISYIIEVEDMSVLTVCNFKTPSETGLTCPLQVPQCVLASSYIPYSVQSQRTHHMMKIHSIEFCAVLGMVHLGFKAVANHCRLHEWLCQNASDPIGWTLLSIRDLSEWHIKDTNAHSQHLTNVNVAASVEQKTHHCQQWSSLREVHDCGHPTMYFFVAALEQASNSACDVVVQRCFVDCAGERSVDGCETGMLDDTSRVETILDRNDFRTPRFPDSCRANFLSLLFYTPTLYRVDVKPQPYASTTTVLEPRAVFANRDLRFN